MERLTKKTWIRRGGGTLKNDTGYDGPTENIAMDKMVGGLEFM